MIAYRSQNDYQKFLLGANFQELEMDELSCIEGGALITIAGITFGGWKAAAIIAAGVTTLAGVAGLGFWNGYNDTKHGMK